MPRVLTVLEAHVPQDRHADLLSAYRSAADDAFPLGLVRSMLVQVTNDPTLWRIETFGSPGKPSTRCEAPVRRVAFRSSVLLGQNRRLLCSMYKTSCHRPQAPPNTT